jgi:tetratricopeptide (TPR) repeat protein
MVGAMKDNYKIKEIKHILRESKELWECEHHLNNGLYNSAIDCFDEALKIKPDNINAMIGKAFALNQIDENKKAEKLMNDCLKIDPKNHHALYIKAEVLRELEKYDFALRLYDILNEQFPADEDYLFGKAETLNGLGRNEEAAGLFDQILEIEKDNGMVEEPEAKEPEGARS